MSHTIAVIFEHLLSKMHRCLFLATLVAMISAEQFNYDGYKVYRLYPLEKQQLDILAALGNNKHLDFWSPLQRDATPVDVMVDPNAQTSFQNFMKDTKISYEILIDDVERIIQQERILQLAAPRVGRGGISFTKYHRHNVINAYLDQLAVDHADLVSLETIGKSYEGRDLKLIKISTDPRANKPIIFIDAGIHAREWIAPPVALYTINQLVENAENRHLLDKIDFHILPVVNPDGYEYSHTKTPLWRKTRSTGIICNGTDGNRNYEFHWAETGSSSEECAEDYHGTKAFSEPETAAIRDYVLRNKDNIKLYLTFHSFGQLLLYPWGFTHELPENSEELQHLGELVAQSIESVAGKTYKVGSSTNVLYAAAGGSDDWVKGVAGVELAYTIELPRGGLFGFRPFPTKILPIVTETWEGIKTYQQYISNKFG